MIEELLRLSECDGVLDEQGFSRRPIHWLIDLDDKGKFLGFSPTVISNRHDGRKQLQVEEVRGKQYSRPAFFFMRVDKKSEVIATAGGGKAVAELGCGSLVEVFGCQIKADAEGKGPTVKVLSSDDKEFSKHQQFVELHRLMAEKHGDVRSLAAVADYLSRPSCFHDENFSDQDLRRIAKEEISFRVCGRPITADPKVRQLWSEEYAESRRGVVAKLPRGNGMFASSAGPDSVLTPVFPHISGLPGGGGWCPLNSFDKAPSQSYGRGSFTVAMPLGVAERASGALNYLLRTPETRMPLGETVAVFWAVPLDPAKRQLSDTGFLAALTASDPLEVRDFFRGIWGAGVHDGISVDRFYCALLSSPQSRVTVRTWHTDTLPVIRKNISHWLRAAGAELPIWDGSTYQKADYSTVSISELAAVTVRKSKDSNPSKSTYTDLFSSATQGSPLSHRLYTAALQRQSLELAGGYDKKERKMFEERLRARTALIQLYFASNRKGDRMPDNYDGAGISHTRHLAQTRSRVWPFSCTDRTHTYPPSTPGAVPW